MKRPVKIVFLDRMTVGDISETDRLDSLGEFISYDSTPPEKTAERIREANVVITNKVVIDAELMDQAPNLKMISIAATGMNNVDLDYARKKNIKVTNVSDYSTFSVTQSTFAMIFYLLNQTAYYDQFVKTGAYAESPVFTHHGREFYELKGKNFGIIGLGNIGRSVAGIAESFQCHVQYYSTSGRNDDPVYKRVGLETLLKTSDLVTIHAPLNVQTENLIGYRELQWMKDRAILINMGRGKIVNEADLARAIDEDLIGGAGLDVLGHEPIEADNPLMTIKHKQKLLITPHIAWASRESRTVLMNRIYEQVHTFLKESEDATKNGE